MQVVRVERTANRPTARRFARFVRRVTAPAQSAQSAPPAAIARSVGADRRTAPSTDGWVDPPRTDAVHTIARTPAAPGSDAALTVTHERRVVGPVAEQLWEAYHLNVGPLADLAILRHVDTHEEFLEQLADDRIVKIVGWRGAEPAGLALLTNSLELVSEISPEFLRARYPDHAQRHAIYFGTLIMVCQPLRGLTLFSRLSTEMWQHVALVGGVLVFDVCEFNRTNFGSDALAQRIADGFPHSSLQVVDRQTWYAAELPEPIPGTER